MRRLRGLRAQRLRADRVPRRVGCRSLYRGSLRSRRLSGLLRRFERALGRGFLIFRRERQGRQENREECKQGRKAERWARERRHADI